MMRRPPRSTRTDTLLPFTTLFRSGLAPPVVQAHHLMGHFVTDKHLCADVMLPDFVVEPVLLRHVGLCLAMKDVGTQLGLHLVDRREQVIRVMSEPTRSEEHTSELQY